MAQKQHIPYRIGNITAGLIIALNIIADSVQILLTFTGVLIPLDELITFFAGSANTVWFTLLGVNIFGGKKATTKVISALATAAVELVPVVDALPTLTIGAISIIMASRAEDRAKATPANDNPLRVTREAA